MRRRRGRLVAALVGLLLLGITPSLAAPTPTPTPTARVGSIDPIQWEGSALTDERLAELAGQIRERLATLKARDTPSSREAAFLQRQLSLLESIQRLYGRAREIRSERRRVAEELDRLTRVRPNEDPQLEALAPSGEEVRQEDVDRIAAALVDRRDRLATLDKDALSLETTLAGARAELAESRKNYADAVERQQDYEEELRAARESGKSVEDIAQIEERRRFRSLMARFEERRAKVLDELLQLIEMKKQLVELRRTYETEVIRLLDALQRDTQQRLRGNLDEEALQASRALEEARERARDEKETYRRHRLDMVVQLRDVALRRLQVRREVAQTLVPASQLTLEVRQLAVDLDVAQGTLRRLEQGGALTDREEEELERRLSAQLLGLRERAMELEGRGVELKSRLEAYLRRLNDERLALLARLDGLESLIAQRKKAAEAAFWSDRRETRYNKARWRAEAAAWDRLGKELRDELRAALGEVTDAATKKVAPVLRDVASELRAVDRVVDFVTSHARRLREPNRMTWQALEQAARDAARWLPGVPSVLVSLLWDDRGELRLRSLLVLTACLLGVVLGASLPGWIQRHRTALPALDWLFQHWAALPQASRPPLRKGLYVLWLAAILLAAVAMLPWPAPYRHGLLAATVFGAAARFLRHMHTMLRPGGVCPFEIGPVRRAGLLHVVRWSRRLAAWLLCTVPLYGALEAAGYSNQGLLDALWLVTALGTYLLILGMLWRRQRLLDLLPAPTDVIRRVARALARWTRPFMSLVGAWILLLRLEGYHAYASEVLGRSTLALAVVLAIPIGTAALLELLEALKQLALRRVGEVLPWRSAVVQVAALFRLLVVAGGLCATAMALLYAAGIGPQSLADLLSSPLPWVDPDASDRVTTYGNLLGGFVVFALTWIVMRTLRTLLLDTWIPLSGMERGLGFAVTSLVYYSGLLVGLVWGLSLLNVGTSQLQWLFAFAGVGIGFGMQEIVTNFISGIIILFERPIKVGDVITVGDTEGRVEAISMRSTRILTRSNIEILVPNKRFITEEVTNWTHSDSVIMLQVEVGVAYGTNVKLVRETLLRVARADRRVLARPPASVRFLDFGDSALLFGLRVAIGRPLSRRQIESDLRYAIHRAFERAGIEIPFPQQDVHLRSDQTGLVISLTHLAEAETDRSPETS